MWGRYFVVGLISFLKTATSILGKGLTVTEQCLSTGFTLSRTEIISPGITGLFDSGPLGERTTAGGCSGGGGGDKDGSLPASPKIGKSLRSRLTGGFMGKSSSGSSSRNNESGSAKGDNKGDGMGGMGDLDAVDNTYVPGDPLNIPTLSPPPYKAPGSTSGGSTSSILNNNNNNNNSSLLLQQSSSSTLLRTSTNGDSREEGEELGGRGCQVECVEQS